MPIETRECPECKTPNEFEVPADLDGWAGKPYRVGSCSGCGRRLFYVPGHNKLLWDLLDPDPNVTGFDVVRRATEGR
jgi:hypothetical protein